MEAKTDTSSKGTREPQIVLMLVAVDMDTRAEFATAEASAATAHVMQAITESNAQAMAKGAELTTLDGTDTLQASFDAALDLAVRLKQREVLLGNQGRTTSDQWLAVRSLYVKALRILHTLAGALVERLDAEAAMLNADVDGTRR